MEVKKCIRCGAMFISSNNVCCNCEMRDKREINKLNNYIEEKNIQPDIEDLSINTTVSISNINRFIHNNSIKGFKNNL